MIVLDFGAWITCQQAGRLLGIGPQRVSDLVDQGELLGIKTSLGRLIWVGSVEELRQRREGRGEAAQ